MHRLQWYVIVGFYKSAPIRTQEVKSAHFVLKVNSSSNITILTENFITKIQTASSVLLFEIRTS